MLWQTNRRGLVTGGGAALLLGGCTTGATTRPIAALPASPMCLPKVQVDPNRVIRTVA